MKCWWCGTEIEGKPINFVGHNLCSQKCRNEIIDKLDELHGEEEE